MGGSQTFRSNWWRHLWIAPYFMPYHLPAVGAAKRAWPRPPPLSHRWRTMFMKIYLFLFGYLPTLNGLWIQGVIIKDVLTSFRREGDTLTYLANYEMHKIFAVLSKSNMHCNYSGVSSLGVPGVPWHPQILADQLTPSQPVGADYAHQIILAPPDFQIFLQPWITRYDMPY